MPNDNDTNTNKSNRKNGNESWWPLPTLRCRVIDSLYRGAAKAASGARLLNCFHTRPHSRSEPVEEELSNLPPVPPGSPSSPNRGHEPLKRVGDVQNVEVEGNGIAVCPLVVPETGAPLVGSPFILLPYRPSTPWR